MDSKRGNYYAVQEVNDTKAIMGDKWLVWETNG
jgi:hypothetical protein